MALTLDTTWGGATANAYLSLADANALITTNVLDFDAWENADSDKQKRAILVATANIDSFDWIGSRYYYTQSLEYPRTSPGNTFPYIYGTEPASGDPVINITESDDYQNRLYLRVRLATAHQALYLLQKNCAPRNVSKHREYQRSGVNSWSKSGAGISESYSYDKTSTMILCSEAFDYLRHYKASPRVVRGDKGGLSFR